MKQMKESLPYIVCFVGGALSVYVTARIFSGKLKENIAKNVTDQVVLVQSNNIGFTPFPASEINSKLSIPVADGVLRGLYLQ